MLLDERQLYHFLQKSKHLGQAVFHEGWHYRKRGIMESFAFWLTNLFSLVLSASVLIQWEQF